MLQTFDRRIKYIAIILSDELTLQLHQWKTNEKLNTGTVKLRK